MNPTPELAGYELDQRLLEHPLAEIWRGRSSTGMEIIALILSEQGAADAQVRDRLTKASRAAALEPHQHQTPLWAANLTTDRPYAVTQLVPGQSGAERLLDPLDGLLGNDDDSLDAVRSQLAQQYGLRPPTAKKPDGGGSPTDRAGRLPDGGGSLQEVLGAWVAQAAPPGAGIVGRPQGWWPKLLSALAVLVVFCALYSVGTKIGSQAKEQEPTPAVLVSPAPLPSPGLLPATPKPK
ncbi:hypothetical protein GCM10009554_18610 [Kribbella koreensis]|uniref:Uncharacterized protein n=1 Tax=Kribbella koreensis TaxID=57909 RepID=A0ABP4AD79_9ACTN